MALAHRAGMAASTQNAYVRRVVIAVGIAASAVLLALGVWAASHMLLLIFGGILLAVLLRALGELLSRYTGIRENRAVWIVLIALVSLIGLGGWYLSGEIAGQFDALGRSLTEMWDQVRSQLEKYGWGQQVLAVLAACTMVLMQKIYVEDLLGDRLERPLKQAQSEGP